MLLWRQLWAFVLFLRPSQVQQEFEPDPGRSFVLFIFTPTFPLERVAGTAALDEPFDLPICVSIFLCRLPSLVNATPRYLNFSTCVSVLPPTTSIHCLGFSEKRNTSFFKRWISFRLGRKRKKTDQVRVGDPDEKMLAVPNHQQIANTWSRFSKVTPRWDWLSN